MHSKWIQALAQREKDDDFFFFYNASKQHIIESIYDYDSQPGKRL